MPSLTDEASRSWLTLTIPAACACLQSQAVDIWIMLIDPMSFADIRPSNFCNQKLPMILFDKHSMVSLMYR